jgi:4-aminobutyrate--pyruvate transaminase
VLQKYDVLFIDDEVICGFGRTGNWFGAETFRMQATSVSMAKQITGAYVPLSAVAMNAEMADAIEAEASRYPSLGHGFTYGGHPLGCAVGVKTLEIYQRRDIVGHVRRMAPIFQARIQSFAGHPLVGEARGVGLMGGLELSPDKAGKGSFKEFGKVGGKLVTELLEHGIILRAMGDVIGICPPMIITEAEIDELFAPMEQCLDTTYAWAKAEGHLG